MRVTARTCAGCGKPHCTAIYGAYWHVECWRKATEAERGKAREAMAAEVAAAREAREKRTP